MAHLRLRYLEAHVKKDLSWSPVVSVLGMRQVGKTTLLRKVGASYLSLDDDELRRKWEIGNWSLLEVGERPLVIDEAQKVPGLFERVKLLVDQKRNTGQFLLTGSVRFLSRKEIRESLTGRTSILELLPLSLSEAHAKPLGTFIDRLSYDDFLSFLKGRKASHQFSSSDVEHYLNHGGMPGICFRRDPQVQRQMRDSHLETLLLRDLQLLVRTRVPYERLKALLQLMAQSQGQPISLSAMGRQVQLSVPTVIQLTQAFVNLFILKPLGKTWYFTDCGMASYLGAARIENKLFHMERWIFSELLAQLNYRHRSSFELKNFATRGGARLPFIVRIEGKRPIGIAVDPSEGASEKSLKSLTSFQRSMRKPCNLVVLHAGSEAYLSASGALCVPYTWIASSW